MIHVIDNPTHDPRWAGLLDRHPCASVFHTPAWLEALRRTYGYEPVAVSTSNGDRIENGLVACRVRAWGANRVISLPFSDHCEPLASKPERAALVEGLVRLARERGWGPVELRPRSPVDDVGVGGLRAVRTYCLHDLDLAPDLPEILDGFHPSSGQRAIRRAEREGITHESGTSDEQLRAFFELLRMTRRRHGVPPQPIAWFGNLRDTMGPHLRIHLARRDGRPLAALFMLSFRNTAVYKYGGSDASSHPLGVMPFLFWQAIQAARAAGATTLDLGRSDSDQHGLIAFKDHLGATRSHLTYYGESNRTMSHGHTWMRRIADRVVSAAPDSALDLAGRLLYRHLG